VRKAHHGSKEDTRAAQPLGGEPDVVWLNGEGGGAKLDRGVGKLVHLCPRSIGTDYRVIEQLGNGDFHRRPLSPRGRTGILSPEGRPRRPSPALLVGRAP
jgi:hypothetical protein